MLRTLTVFASSLLAAAVFFSYLDRPAAQAANPESKIALAKCLASNGATLYGASWCPVCTKQRRSFGEGSTYLTYVECSEDGTKEHTTRTCQQMKISSFPTWIFANGSKHSGLRPLPWLAKKAGCPFKK